VVVDADFLQRRDQIVLDSGCEAHQRAAADECDPRFPAQAEQTLAQAVVGLLRRSRRPEHGGEVVALDRPRQGDDGEQGRVLRSQRDLASTVDRNELGPTQQAQLPRGTGIGARDAGRGDGAGHAAQCGVLRCGRQLKVEPEADRRLGYRPAAVTRRVTATARYRRESGQASATVARPAGREPWRNEGSDPPRLRGVGAICGTSPVFRYANCILSARTRLDALTKHS
jgi:hypothetical protein